MLPQRHQLQPKPLKKDTTMGQYYIPTIFRKDANIAAVLGNEPTGPFRKETPEEQINRRERPVAALLSHDFKYRYKRDNSKIFTVGVGMKLMEHSYVGNAFVRGVEYLLEHEYAGCPIVWVGDYADETFKDDEGGDTTAYDLGDKITKQTWSKLPARRVYNRYRKYLVNEDTNEYVIIPHISEKEYRIHPLPLLTADGNGRGGGDYHLNNPWVGKWRGHHLRVTNNIPSRAYERIEPEFALDD